MLGLSERILRRKLMNNSNKSYKLALGIAIVFLLVTVLVTGCSLRKASSETGVISEITMSTAVDSDNRPVNPTTVFTTDAAGFYCSFKLSGFPLGAKLEAKWIYVGGDPDAELITGKNAVIETQPATIEKEGQGYTATVYANPLPDYKWPKGDYQVVISVDGLEKGSTTFKVE
jgi:hypothetical protein